MIKSIIKKTPLYIIFFIIILHAIPHLSSSINRIYDGLKKIDTYPRQEYKAKLYGHMVIDFISSVTTELEITTLPYLIYPTHNGDLYGVAMLLDGYRVNVNKDIIMFLDMDKPIWKDDKSKCQREINNNNLTKICQLPDNYIITGIQFSEAFGNSSHTISFECKNKIISKFIFDKSNLIHSENIPYDNLLKIPNKDKFYKTINKKDCDKTITITISDIKENDFHFSITGLSGEGGTAGNVMDNVPEHIIILWDKKDARNYLAVNKNNLNKILNKYKFINNSYKD